jgi:hypothetical protein
MAENPPDVTQIPAPRVDFIDKRTGLMSREWYRFFVNIYNIAGGGGSAVSLADLQVSQIGGVSFDSVAEMMKTLQDLEVQPPVVPPTSTTYSVFTSSTSGLTPASGGGTVNYLRADATWASPTGGVVMSSGVGSPNGVVVGSPGDMYLNTSGGAGTTLYIKESGSATNTGWVAK